MTTTPPANQYRDPAALEYAAKVITSQSWGNDPWNAQPHRVATDLVERAQRLRDFTDDARTNGFDGPSGADHTIAVTDIHHENWSVVVKQWGQRDMIRGDEHGDDIPVLFDDWYAAHELLTGTPTWWCRPVTRNHPLRPVAEPDVTARDFRTYITYRIVADTSDSPNRYVNDAHQITVLTNDVVTDTVYALPDRTRPHGLWYVVDTERNWLWLHTVRPPRDGREWVAMGPDDYFGADINPDHDIDPIEEKQ